MDILYPCGVCASKYRFVPREIVDLTIDRRYNLLVTILSRYNSENLTLH